MNEDLTFVYILVALVVFMISWLIQHYIIKGAVKSALRDYDEETQMKNNAFKESLERSDLLTALGANPELFYKVNSDIFKEYNKRKTNINYTELSNPKRIEKLEELELELLRKSHEQKTGLLPE